MLLGKEVKDEEKSKIPFMLIVNYTISKTWAQGLKSPDNHIKTNNVNVKMNPPLSYLEQDIKLKCSDHRPITYKLQQRKVSLNIVQPRHQHNIDSNKVWNTTTILIRHLLPPLTKSKNKMVHYFRYQHYKLKG